MTAPRQQFQCCNHDRETARIASVAADKPCHPDLFQQAAEKSHLRQAVPAHVGTCAFHYQNVFQNNEHL